MVKMRTQTKKWLFESFPFWFGCCTKTWRNKAKKGIWDMERTTNARTNQQHWRVENTMQISTIIIHNNLKAS